MSENPISAVSRVAQNADRQDMLAELPNILSYVTLLNYSFLITSEEKFSDHVALPLDNCYSTGGQLPGDPKQLDLLFAIGMGKNDDGRLSR